MKIKTVITDEEGYINVALSGRYDLKELKALGYELWERVKFRQCHFVLLDMSRLKGEIPDWDRFQLGEFAAELWGGTVKLAVIDRDESDGHFAETVAVNRGARFSSFLDKGQALTWLLESEQ